MSEDDIAFPQTSATVLGAILPEPWRGDAVTLLALQLATGCEHDALDDPEALVAALPPPIRELARTRLAAFRARSPSERCAIVDWTIGGLACD